MKRTLGFLVPAAAAVAIAVSGCGSGGSVAGDPVAKAAAATTSAHGSRLAMDMTMSTAALPQPIHMTANGVMDPVTKQGRIVVDMSDLAGVAGGSIKASQLKATEILDGTTFYMRLPLLDGKLPGHKKWMKVDIAKAGQALGLNLGQFMQPGQDPTQQLAYLRTVSGAKKVGSETIRGVPTTHYHGFARLDRYPQLLPPSQRASARAAVQRLTKLIGANGYPIDAWVDKAGMIRRVRFTMSTKIPQTTQRMKMAIQEDLYDFGVDANVPPPPSDEVFDATSATQKALRASGLGG
jgi:hypothetical protein